MNPAACAILLPAAGASKRMGGTDKLVQTVGDVPLLRRVASRALRASARVAVTLPPDAPARVAALSGLQVKLIEVADATEGMAASLRAGATWAQKLPIAALMIALPDMPDITADDMRALIAAQARHPLQPLRACTSARAPGHPTILPRALLAELRALKGDTGARALLKAHPPRLHPLAGQRALTDLDTPRDWAAWSART